MCIGYSVKCSFILKTLLHTEEEAELVTRPKRISYREATAETDVAL